MLNYKIIIQIIYMHCHFIVNFVSIVYTIGKKLIVIFQKSKVIILHTLSAFSQNVPESIYKLILNFVTKH
jgi:hypothetical protein